MGEKSHYNYRVEPQDVDFTLRATIPSLGSAILNTAGIDAHGKGFGVDALNADNHSWVLSRMAVEFDCQPGQYTDYTIATWINEYGRVLSTRNFTLTDAAGNEFGRAVTQWAMIDLRSRSALDLSWVGDAHADAIVDAPSPTDKPRKIRDVDPAQTAVHKVVYSDIDFNRHVNTMRYIEMMIDMLPLEMLMQEAPVRLDIHFLRECRYGQTLAVGYEQRGLSRYAAMPVRWPYVPLSSGNRPAGNVLPALRGTGFAGRAAKPFFIMETAVKTQNKYQVSIDLLNDAVGKEIATSLQYMYFHTHFEDDRYQYLSKIMREISIAEMRHIEEFSDRIMFLQGDVDMNASFRTKQVTDAKEMLRLAMQLEQSTIDSYNEASRIAAEHKDAVTHKMFQDIIVEEEEHLDTFRTELQHMLDYGEEYLALQSAAGSKHTAKSFKHTDDGE